MTDNNPDTPTTRGPTTRLKLPMSPQPPPPPLLRSVSSGSGIHFGVVGEGRSKKILGFGSFGSVSEVGNYTSVELQ